MSLALGSKIRTLTARYPRLYRWARRALVIGRYFARRPHEADFAAFGHFAEESGLFLDVGANAGQSALSFRIYQRRSPILSIEPNPYHEPDLRFVQRIAGNIEYLICGASDRADNDAVLYVPLYRGVPLTGEASFDKSGLSDSYWYEHHGVKDSAHVSVLEIPTTIRRLDDLRLSPAFVKIDVEGFELPVLKGLQQTIEMHRPILLVESSSGRDQVEAFMGQLDYSPYVYRADRDSFERLSGNPLLNLFYLPESQLERLRSLGVVDDTDRG
jgi:FkbM family methyltransferase